MYCKCPRLAWLCGFPLLNRTASMRLHMDSSLGRFSLCLAVISAGSRRQVCWKCRKSLAAGENATSVQRSPGHEVLRRWTATSTIQAHWRARTLAAQDVGGAGAAELRARHKHRNSARKTAGKLALIMAQLAAECVGVAEQARHHEVAEAPWFKVRGTAWP